MNEFELFNQIRLRDRNAFDTLFRKYYASLCRFSYAFCLSRENAEESVQEMFVQLWDKAPMIQVNTSVKAYLYTSARNHILNLIKKHRTEAHHQYIYTEEANDNDHDQKMPDAEISELIQKGLKELPEKCREIFILCKQEGLTYEEIATYLDISEKTVDNQIGIALRKLRDFLRPKLQKLMIYYFFFWGK